MIVQYKKNDDVYYLLGKRLNTINDFAWKGYR